MKKFPLNMIPLKRHIEQNGILDLKKVDLKEMKQQLQWRHSRTLWNIPVEKK